MGWFDKQLGGYSVGKKLGAGKYSTVRIATKIETGETFAIKIIKKDSIKSEDDWNRIRRETQVLTSLDHPNIINLFEVFQTKYALCIVTDYVSGGDLFNYIVNQPSKRLTPSEAFSLFRQMVAAMSYCHSRFVIHRDLKPENIFLTSKKKVKIGDFGFARTFSPGNPMDTPCGSFAYAAPEVIAGKKYLGAASDVWSLGCILYVMLTGGLPFKGTNNVDTMQRLRSGSFIESPNLNEATRKFLKEIFTPNPEYRITIQELVQHKAIWQDKPLLGMLVRPFANVITQHKKEVQSETTPLRRSFSESDLSPSVSQTPSVYVRPKLHIHPAGQENTKQEEPEQEDDIEKDLGSLLPPKNQVTRSNSQADTKTPHNILLVTPTNQSK